MKCRTHKICSNVVIWVFLLASCGKNEKVKSDRNDSEIEGRSITANAQARETVRDCMKRLNLKLGDAIYSDEPPGKLACLRFEQPDGKDLVINLKYSKELFSDRRKWNYDAVLNASVLEVTYEAHD